LAAAFLRDLYAHALGITNGLDPEDPRKNFVRKAGDDLLTVLQRAAIKFVLGHPGIVRVGGLFAVQHGICTLAPYEPGESPLRKKQRYDGESIIAEPLVVQAFAQPLVVIFEKTILESENHSDVGYKVEDYLALRHDTLINAVKITAFKGAKEFNLPCESYAKEWSYRDIDYYVQIVERCDKTLEEIAILRYWLKLKRSGVIMPVTTHGADLILLAWAEDVPLVILVQSKSGASSSTPKALLSLTLPYTTDRAKGMAVTSSPGKEWETFLVDNRCLVAYMVFKPLEGSQAKPVGWEKDRLVVIVDRNSWHELASNLELGIKHLARFKD
jgi:hypothetical protein